jgi:predicted phosphodiesterase
MQRFRLLPARGTLLVSSDLHGNLEDFLALRAIFEATPGAHWIQLGDIVHGPNDEARREHPELYGFPDRSHAIVAGFLDLIGRFPERVHYVLGNHDYGHVGGPRTRKFYPDEVAALEGTLTESQRGDLRALFAAALFAAAAPCGVLLAHGSPDDELASLDDLDAIPLEPIDPSHARVLKHLLTSYGQVQAKTARLLARVSRPGLDLRVVVHGHDRDDRGFFIEGNNQVCPCIFGAPRWTKRYIRLDLGARYESAADLRDGAEILRLYPSAR